MMKKSWKSNECHAGLEYFIDELDPHPDASRSGKVNRAIVKAKNLSDGDWEKLNKELKLFKKNELSQIDVPIPTAMQVKIEEGAPFVAPPLFGVLSTSTIFINNSFIINYISPES